MITHYDMRTGNIIGTGDALGLSGEDPAYCHTPTPRLVTVDEAIAEEQRATHAHPAVVMLPITELLASGR